MSTSEHHPDPTHLDASDETMRVVTIINPALMTLDEASAYLTIPKGTIYQWRSRRPGYFPAPVLIGRALRFRKVDLDAWIEDRIEHVAASDWESERGAASHPMPSMTRKRRSPVRLAG